MGKIGRFEDIEAWPVRRRSTLEGGQKARALVKEVYQACRVESYRKDYNRVDQTRKAAVLIMANIAEGFARRTNREFINFLGMSHGSTAELQSHFYAAFHQQYLSEEDFQTLYTKTEEVSKMIQGFSNYLRNHHP